MIRHIISAVQFKEPKILNSILDKAEEMEDDYKKGKLRPVLKDKILASVFYEASTRTRFSFESAMIRLGGTVIGTENASEFSSAIKGESLADSIRIIGNYADVIVVRHHKKGASKFASKFSKVPLINAGDGTGEHPTQALIDVYTIRKEKGRLGNLKVALIGDLKYGRTVHSLVYLLAQEKNIELFFVSPEELKMPVTFLNYLKVRGIPFKEVVDLKEIASEADVLYVTRVQKERFKNPRKYEKLKGFYIVNKEIMQLAKKDCTVMHPLPRVDEISPDIDSDPRAAYFRQAENGLYVRMALLDYVLNNKK